MKLDTAKWKWFNVSRIKKEDIIIQAGLFEIESCKCKCASDLDDGDEINYVGAKKNDNGIMKRVKIEKELVSKGNGILFICDGQGSVGYTNYMKDDFIGSTTTSIGYDDELNELRAMFLVTILDKERYKYSFGRKYRRNLTAVKILLPIKQNINKEPEIDKTRKYSSDGYIPNWEFMEKYIQALNHHPITTNNTYLSTFKLDCNDWEFFYLKDLFNCSMGTKIDYCSTTKLNPTINFISRSNRNNGVIGVVDNIDIIKPFKEGSITLALGGSIGSCFVQNKIFYTGQNIAILEEKEKLTIYAKLFLATIIQYECKIKYIAFGRELNRHYNKDFVIKLPIQKDKNKKPKIDKTYKYSNNGYVPDWEFMENYVKSLPYGDKI